MLWIQFCLRVSVLPFLLASCASAFHEAYTEQTENVLSTAPQSIRFGCNSGTKNNAQPAAPPLHEGHLQVGALKDSRRNKGSAGRMFSSGPPWGMFTGRRDWSIALSFESDAAPETILLEDIVHILERNGFVIERAPGQQSDEFLLLDVELLDANVQSHHTGFTETRGRITAKVFFRAALVDIKTKRIAWQMDFPQEETIEVDYFLKRYHEETLKKAYCHALDRFEAAIRTDPFNDAVHGRLQEELFK